MKNSQIAMSLLAAVAIPAISAKADTITFVFDGTEGVSSYSKTVDGVTLSLTNPTESDNVFAFSVIGSSNKDLDLSAPGVLVSAFDFSFDTNVTLVSYNVGVIDGASAGTFTLTGPDSSSSAGNTVATTGDHTFVGTFTLNANDTGVWTADIPSGTYPTIHSITVSTSAVPEPSDYALFGSAFVGMAVFASRRFKAKTVAKS
jgi:hypothetical protein